MEARASAAPVTVPEWVNAIDMAKSPNSRPAKPTGRKKEGSGIYFIKSQEPKRLAKDYQALFLGLAPIDTPKSKLIRQLFRAT